MAHSWLLAVALLLALSAQPGHAQLIGGRIGSRLNNTVIGTLINNRLEGVGSPVANTTAITCPVNPATTQLNFSAIVTGCPSVSVDNTTDFCAPCICALTDAYMPALAAYGILNATENTTFPQGSAMDAATAVVRACTSSFLTPALAAGVDIRGLDRLARQCNFTADNVPDCLRERLAPLQPATPAVRSADLRPSGGGDYIEDNTTALADDVQRSASNAVPVTGVAPGTLPNTTQTAGANPQAANSSTTSTSPAAAPAVGVPTDPVSGLPVAANPPAGAATPPAGAADPAVIPDYNPIPDATPDTTAVEPPPAVAVPEPTPADVPATTPATTTEPVPATTPDTAAAPVPAADAPAPVPAAEPVPQTTPEAPAPTVKAADKPNSAATTQLPVQLMGALVAASLLALAL